MGLRNRALIVNADDFGQSAGINRGIAEAHERGVVTSASMMVLWPTSAAAAAYARSRSALSVGLHFDFGEWVWRHGGWAPLYSRVDLTDSAAIEEHARMQLDRFRHLMRRDPTHLDSHQHVHRRSPVREVVARMASELAIPLRHVSPVIRHQGDFYGQDATGEALPHLISAEALSATLHRLADGVTELACHPGYADDIDTMYRSERSIEIQVLCAPQILCVIVEEDIQLVSFHELTAV